MANTKVRTFRIPDELWNQLDAVAKENETTKTSVVITALEYLIMKAGNK